MQTPEGAMTRDEQPQRNNMSEDTTTTTATPPTPNRVGDAEDTMIGDKDEASAAVTKENIQYGWRFWAIFPALCVTTLLAAVETTVTSTALPTITQDLNAGELYVWFVNAYLLTR